MGKYYSSWTSRRKDRLVMRGLEEIIHENEKIVEELKVKVTDLEVAKRILAERVSDLEWQIDRLESQRY